MEASRRANAIYGDPRTSVKSPSQVEYQAFARITKDLTAAAEGQKDAFPRLAAALHQNLRLWTIVATDVAVENNALPKDLRAQLFYLAEFTRAHTGKVLKGEAVAGALIDINTAVMKGLRTQQDPLREPASCPA